MAAEPSTIDTHRQRLSKRATGRHFTRVQSVRTDGDGKNTFAGSVAVKCVNRTE